jgi:hypothetical protein
MRLVVDPLHDARAFAFGVLLSALVCTAFGVLLNVLVRIAFGVWRLVINHRCGVVCQVCGVDCRELRVAMIVESCGWR